SRVPRARQPEGRGGPGPQAPGRGPGARRLRAGEQLGRGEQVRAGAPGGGGVRPRAAELPRAARAGPDDAGAVLGGGRARSGLLRPDARAPRPPPAGRPRRPVVRRPLDGHVGRLRGRDRGGRHGRARRRGDLRPARPPGQPLLARRRVHTMTGERRQPVDRDALQPLPVDVVSIQSQVVYGCVGNSVAVPTLQALGLSVAAVPTVLLSNVPHYDTLHGGPVPTEWFAGYLSDLERRRALESARVILVGYLGPPEQTLALADWVERVLVEYPHLNLVLDPVMGDGDVG